MSTNNLDINVKIDKNSLEYDMLSLMNKYHKEQRKQINDNTNNEYKKLLEQKDLRNEIVRQVKRELLKGKEWKNLCVMLQKEGFIYRCPTCMDVSEQYGKIDIKGIY